MTGSCDWDYLVLTCVLCVHVAAKDSSLSPAESMAVYDNYSRKQKHHWRNKMTRQAAVSDQVTEATVSGLQGAAAASSWTVSGTSQWQYPTDVIVSSASDLLHLQQFLVGKVCHVGAIRM